jgi:hypothetical protein
MHVSGSVSPAGGAIYEVYNSPIGQLDGKVQIYSGPTVTPVEELHPDGAWSLRPTFGTLVVAAQRNGVSDKSDTVNLALDVYERWITLRGDQGYAP